MKISELIRKLEHEFRFHGDIDVYISIDTKNKTMLDNNEEGILSTPNLVTSCSNIRDDDWVFGIRNWTI